jgi:transcriptional regulator with XRE-family HTH domain
MDLHSSIMDEAEAHINARLAARVRGLRADRGLTLDGLAQRAGVSRSMISLVERGESSPTAALLDRLAAGLGVTLASLFADDTRPGASPVARRGDQVTWRDPESGYLRRNLSPPGFPSPIELVEISLPPGTRVAYDTGTRTVGISQQVWVLEGGVEVTVGKVTHRLEVGDCLAMRVDRPTAFLNPADRPARYLVALTADSAPVGYRGGNDRGSTP